MQITKTALCAGSALALLASFGAARAQTAASSIPAAGPSASPAPGDGAAPVGEVVVTGSLIRRSDYVSQSPIVTVQSQVLQQSGPAGSIDVGLSQLPQFTPTAGASTQYPNRLGQALLNLRGLGSNRMLVLIDGRRVQPSGADGSVDVDLIPSGLIQSVETITGGASSIYGSDAVTGVVNFKLIDHFQGAKLNVQFNEPEIGGGYSYNGNLILGTDFAGGKGSVEVSLDYTQRGELQAGANPFYQLSRSNAVIPLAVVNFGAAPPTQAAVNSVFGKYGVGAGVASATKPIGVNYDGTLFTDAPINQPVSNYKGPLGGLYLNVNNSIIYGGGQEYDIVFPMQRGNFYGKVSYDLPNDIKLYGNILYSKEFLDVNISNVGLGTTASYIGTVPVTNPFIPADLQTLLASRTTPTAPFSASYLFTNIPRNTFDTTEQNIQAVVGAQGPLASTGWTWDVYTTYGQTTTSEQVDAFSLAAAEQLLNAPDGGASLCSGGLNIFGPPSNISAACSKYIENQGIIAATFNQVVVNATVQGKPFSLPAGEVNVVGGVNYLYHDVNSVPTANFIAGDVSPQGVILPFRGSQSTEELFIETLLPIVKDAPFIKEFNIDAAYRFSEYATGGVSTYKADVDWESVGGIRFRGGYARAVRAPSLADLYSPATLSSTTIGTPAANNTTGDPCDVRSSYRTGANAAQVRALCLAQGVPSSIIDSYTYTNVAVFPDIVGNTNLKPETADTYTVGAVWRSPFGSPLFNRLQASIDYYDIKVTNAIGSVPFLTSLGNCFNADKVSNPTYTTSNIFCNSVKRNSLGQIDSDSVSQTLNLADYRTDGIDFQVDWKVGLGAVGLDDRYGSLTLNFVGTKLNDFIVQPFQTAPALNYAGYTQGSITFSVLPKWKSVTTLTYGVGPATLGVRWRYLDAVQDVSKVTTVGSTTPGVPAISYFDLNGTWALHWPKDIQLRAGVTNLLDRGIPQVGAAAGATDPTTYDIIGRSFYMGATVRF